MQDMESANVDWITDTLATGGDLSFAKLVAAQQITEIVQSGVTDIVDMREEAEDHHVWADMQVRYERFGTTDAAGHHIPARLFDLVIKTSRRVEQNGGKLLVHCHMGINRGPSAAYAVLLDRGMDPIEAFDLIRRQRPQAALYYAPDALSAHHKRRIREKNLGFDAPAERKALNDHIDATMTPETLQNIRHIIRQHHKKDAQELASRGQ